MLARTLAGPPWPLIVNVVSIFLPRFNSRISARCGECRVAALLGCRIDGKTQSRIVFPHRLLNYSGQGFLWRDPGSSRQTDTAGRSAGRSPAWQEYSGSVQKKKKKFQSASASVAVKTGQFTGRITNERGRDLAELRVQGLPRSRRSMRRFMQI